MDVLELWAASSEAIHNKGEIGGISLLARKVQRNLFQIGTVKNLNITIITNAIDISNKDTSRCEQKTGGERVNYHLRE